MSIERNLNSRIALLTDTLGWYANGNFDGGALARNTMETERIQTKRVAAKSGPVSAAYENAYRLGNRSTEHV